MPRPGRLTGRSLRVLTAPNIRHPYSDQTVWATKIGGSPTIDPNSSTLITNWLTYAIVSPNLSITGFGVATAESKATDPLHTPTITNNRAVRTDPSFRIPQGAIPTTGSDHHLSIIDVGNSRIHDLYDVIYTSGTPGSYEIGGGQSAQYDNNNNGRVPVNGGDYWGANAAKMPSMACLIRPEEIATGYIGHALAFGNPNIGAGAHRYPGCDNVPTGAQTGLVEGTWLQLDPAVDLNSATYDLRPWEKVIAKAMQEYGMFLRDNSGSLAIYGENTNNRGGDSVWVKAGVPLTGSAPLFRTAFPWASMRVLSPPPEV